MKLIKFILVTSVIFSVVDVFATSFSFDREIGVSPDFPGSKCLESNSNITDTQCSLSLTCRPATTSDPKNFIVTECWCLAIKSAFGEYNFNVHNILNKSIRDRFVLADWVARSYNYIEDIESEDIVKNRKQVAKDLCFFGLRWNMKTVLDVPLSDIDLELEFFIHWRCSEPSICYEWQDANRNGREDAGEFHRGYQIGDLYNTDNE